MKKIWVGILIVCIVSMTGCSNKQKTMYEGENLQYTYLSRSRKREAEIYQKFLSGDSEIIWSVNQASVQGNFQQVILAVNSAYLDVPEIKLLGRRIEIDKNGLYFYTPNEEEGLKKIELVEAEAEKILDDLQLEGLEPSEKYRRIYEFMVDNVGYVPTEKVYDGVNPEFDDESTVYGALVNKSANSEGIADGYKLLTAKAGLEAMIVTGLVDNLVHSWIIIPDEQGEFLVIDPTMGKIDKEKYFLNPDLELSGRVPYVIWHRDITVQ